MQQIRQYTKNIGITPGGMPIDITFTEITSGKPGPHLYVQSGIHGGELAYWAVQELFVHFSANSNWTGKLTLVGAANPIAWSQRTYFSTNGKFDLYDGRDWNRNFPGDPESSLAQRITAVLFAVAKTADLAIDLHTSRNSPPFSITIDDKSLELAKTNGIPYIFHVAMNEQAKQRYRGTLLLALAEVGVTNMTIECGAHDSYEPTYVEQVKQALLAMASNIGMSPTKNAPGKTKPIVFSEYATYNAPNGGYFRASLQPGTEYREGQTLYKLYNPTNFSALEIKAKENGIVLKISPTHIVHPGDEVIQSIASK